MSRPTVLVDPRFRQRLNELRRQRGLSYRELGRLAAYSHTYVWEIETGRKPPTVEVATVLDTALAAGGDLARLVTAYEPPVTPDDEARLVAVTSSPRRIDAATVESLAVMLAHQRRMEDTAGSAPLVAPVVAQLGAVESFIRTAPDTLRSAMVKVAAQWAQFAGWLCTTTGDHARGRHWYRLAFEWAAEAGDADMMATALSMRGHLAWTLDQTGPMLALSQAALWQPAGPAVRALAAQQEARAHALLGHAEDCDSRLDMAEDLAYQAAEAPDELPPWLYFYEPDFFVLQRGLAQHYLGRHEKAAELLTGGLDRLPNGIRLSDWIGWYVVQLADAHAAAGDLDVAAGAAEEAREIAETTGARRLAGDVDRLARQLGL